MAEFEPTVFIVDDDSAVLKGLRLLIKSVNINAETYLSANNFWQSYDPARPGCLLLDVRMPGMSGLELQKKLQESNINIPIIIMTGYGDVSVATQALKNGAMDVVEKPCSGDILLDQIKKAFAEDAQNRRLQAVRDMLAARLASLTPRERQVMDFIIDGKPNKNIAIALGISQKTVEFHRSNVMKKMKADSAVGLLRLMVVAGYIDIPNLPLLVNIIS